MKTSWEQLWLFWLFVLWGSYFVQAATIETNYVNQTASATSSNLTRASTGGKKKEENNLAMQQPKQQKGSLFTTS